MTTPPYPLVPTPMTKGWLERHPAWKIPLGLLTLIFLLGVFGAGVMLAVEGSFHHSEVFARAMESAGQNVQVRQKFGSPLKAEGLISGNLHVNGSSGNADLSIPIAGPQQKGTIRAVAVKIAGVWRFTYLQVSVKGQRECVDLLATDATPNPDP